jgi:GNAT superfamily N-acetyltransferase
VETPAVDVYVGAFLARYRPDVDEGGLHGLLPSTDDRLARLLVTDDRAYGALAAILPDTDAGMITVFNAAARCTELLAGGLSWTRGTATAMACRDLSSLPSARLPDALEIRPVRRIDGDARKGVKLADAVAAAMRADPGIQDEPAVFAAYLRSLSPAFRLMAAVDGGGVVRGTSGWGAFGAYARVMFVNTDPDWRRRGIGRGMTSAALHAARDSGATRAGLDASVAGGRIYRHLGFEPVAEVTRFYRARQRGQARMSAVRFGCGPLSCRR